jgi:flagellum-specific peptidoglycan hydrolase FlgJ
MGGPSGLPFSFGAEMNETEFLARACAAARAAGHVWPEFAACEAALESAWGASELAVKANNLFGQKQSHPPVGATLTLPTREFLRDTWVTVQAQWVRFADWNASFAERMRLLRSLSAEYPHYADALAATTGEGYVAAVSKSWSTDPQRAEKILTLHRQHFGVAGVLGEVRAVAA